MDKFTRVVIYDENTQTYTGFIKEMPAAISEADTIKDLHLNLDKAIELVLKAKKS